jgi:hypothetical protein
MRIGPGERSPAAQPRGQPVGRSPGLEETTTHMPAATAATSTATIASRARVTHVMMPLGLH